jgi:hypothetical protein
MDTREPWSHADKENCLAIMLKLPLMMPISKPHTKPPIATREHTRTVKQELLILILDIPGLF